ncbi:DUF1269 domain-containing protein [Paracoccus luteus]|uniref:DUF1269 domain-containing protein n=1 Tax=Paracoccus luteus TaxID=2508543 RepID=UPI00106F5F14|nr:DUF1269 domain-containing protein [Paracoccus luteus]
MSQLIVIGFDNQADAFELRQDLVKAQAEYLIRLEDAVVVTRPSAGEYQLHQAVNLASAGALGGTFWGGLIGLLFLNPLLGAAVGAASGAVAGRYSDYGINDDFIRSIGKTVPEGSAAVFILAREVNTDKLLPRLEKYGSGARVIQTSMSDADEARLRETMRGAVWQTGAAAPGGAASGGAAPGGAASGGAAPGGAAPGGAASGAAAPGGAATVQTTGSAPDTASDAPGHHSTAAPRA